MSLFRRIAAWLSSRRRADELADELEAHRAFAQDELARAGLSPAEANAESYRRMGNVTLAREDSREVWIVRWVDRLRQHARYGVRGLVRERVFALTAIATLALGTAAVTSVFSVVDAELWRKLPYPDVDRVVVLRSRGPEPRRDTDMITLAEFQEWRQSLPALSSIAASADPTRRAVRVTFDDLKLDFTQSMSTSEVTANYFSMFGRRAIAGRVFDASDARASNAMLLGERGWQRVFQRDPGVIGRTVLIDGYPHVIVGIVAPDDSSGGLEAEVFLPIDEAAAPDKEARLYGGAGRLADAATVDHAREQLQRLIDRRAATDPSRAGHTANVEIISDYYKRSDARPLYFFLGASLFVLILTVVNLAGLVLARGVRRMPEFALRGALGGGARAIAGQLATEGALIAVPGCVLGLWLTRQAMGLLSTVVPQELLWRGTHVAVDYRAVLFVSAIILVAIAGLALAPLGVARRADASIVKASGSRTSGLPWASRLRERLVIAQIALTVVLLVGGALFLKSFVALTRVPLGYASTDGWSLSVSLSGDRYKEPAAVLQYMDRILAELRAIPGVRGAALASSSPLRSGWVMMSSEVGAETHDTGLRSIYRAVGPGYFRTIGTPITRGRPIDETDVTGAPNVAVVNEEFVRQFFHGADPIGRDVVIKGVHNPVPASRVTIVGVAANIKEVGLNEVPFADVYTPFAQKSMPGGELIVRGNGPNANMPALLRAAAAKADPSVPVSGIAPIERRVTLALAEDRFNLTLAAGFALAALLIASIGIYGAMAYAAAARSREFGVRLALGASPRRLLGQALWHAARFGLIGGGAGILLALGSAVWIGDALYLVPQQHNGLLFNVRTTDPTVLAGATLGVILVALAAGYLPARRLAKIDPVKILRAD